MNPDFIPPNRRIPAIHQRYTPGCSQPSILISDATSKMDARTAAMRSCVTHVGGDTSARRSGTVISQVTFGDLWVAVDVSHSYVYSQGRERAKNNGAGVSWEGPARKRSVWVSFCGQQTNNLPANICSFTHLAHRRNGATDRVPVLTESSKDREEEADRSVVSGSTR